MGVPSHSFSTNKSAEIHTLTPRERTVARLVAAAQAPAAPDCAHNRQACSFAAQVAGDPIRNPDELTMAIRAFPVTETALQSLVRSEGLTFWGEAIELILNFCATHPALAPVEGVLAAAPNLLFSRGGDNRGGFNAPRPSRSILAPLSPWTVAWINSNATRSGVAPAKLAAAILRRHARPVAAFIHAANLDS